MPWIVSQATYVFVEIALVGLGTVFAALGGHYKGLFFGILIAIIFCDYCCLPYIRASNSRR